MMTSTLSVHPRELADALAAVKPAVNRRSIVNAISGVRVTSGYGAASLTATNVDVWVVRDLAEIVTNGLLDVLVSHDELAKATKLLARADSIGLSLVDDKLRVTGANRTIDLRLLRLEDFPPVPDMERATPLFTADAASLARTITRAAVFASTDEARPVLTGILFDCKPDAPMDVVATDSYRLCALPLTAARYGEARLIAPASALKLAAKRMKTGVITVDMLEPRMVVLTNRDAAETWVVRRIEGTFPNHRQLLPELERFEHELRAPTKALRSAFELADTMLTHNAPARLTINGTTKVSGRVPDGPEFTEDVVGAEHIRRAGAVEEIEFGINPSFALDCAKVATGDALTMRLISPLRPALFEDGEDRFLVMPIRLNV